MNINNSIIKLTNFASRSDDDENSITGVSDGDFEKIKSNLLSGDPSLTKEALNDALSSFKVHDDLKSNAAFMRSFKQKNPKGYEEFQKYSTIIEDKKSKIPSAKEQAISATKKARNIESLSKISEALSRTMEEPLSGIFTALMDMLGKRSADAMKLAAMKDDATGLSLMDEAAALSNDGGESLKEAGAEIDDEAVSNERKAISEGNGNSSIAKAGAIPESTKKNIQDNPTPTSTSSASKNMDIKVTDESSARKLGESLGKSVHGDKFDQDIFDDIFDKALDKFTNDDGDINWNGVGAYLRNVYRAAGHTNNFSKLDPKIQEKVNQYLDNASDEEVNDKTGKTIKTISRRFRISESDAKSYLDAWAGGGSANFSTRINKLIKKLS